MKIPMIYEFSAELAFP